MSDLGLPLRWSQDARLLDEEEDYLFRPHSLALPFAEVGKELAHLNDFWFLCEQNLKATSKWHAWRQERLMVGEEQLVDPEIGDISLEVAWQHEDYKIKLGGDFRYTLRAFCAVTLMAQAERWLRNICEFLEAKRFSRLRRQASESIIESYVRFLETEANLNLVNGHSVLLAINELRKSRNVVAHGRWQEPYIYIFEDDSMASPRQDISAVSGLFRAVEDGYVLTPYFLRFCEGEGELGIQMYKAVVAECTQRATSYREKEYKPLRANLEHFIDDICKRADALDEEEREFWNWEDGGTKAGTAPPDTHEEE